MERTFAITISVLHDRRISTPRSITEHSVRVYGSYGNYGLETFHRQILEYYDNNNTTTSYNNNNNKCHTVGVARVSRRAKKHGTMRQMLKKKRALLR
jgi:hypothetical protein